MAYICLTCSWGPSLFIQTTSLINNKHKHKHKHSQYTGWGGYIVDPQNTRYTQ